MQFSFQYITERIKAYRVYLFSLDVISEGVEESDLLQTLKDIGCDFVQGFIWGHPLSKEEVEKLVLI